MNSHRSHHLFVWISRAASPSSHQGCCGLYLHIVQTTTRNNWNEWLEQQLQHKEAASNLQHRSKNLSSFLSPSFILQVLLPSGSPTLWPLLMNILKACPHLLGGSHGVINPDSADTPVNGINTRLAERVTKCTGILFPSIMEQWQREKSVVMARHHSGLMGT